MKLINGNEFTKMAAFYLDEHILGGGLTKELLGKDAIIFCKIDYIFRLFDFIRFSNKRYILVTHNSDFPVDAFRFNSRPSCIKKWFGQNVVIDHPDLINIPIGLENEIRRNGTPIVDYPWFYENMNRLQNKEKISKVYCNWSPTNESRNHIVRLLEPNNIPFDLEPERLSHKEYCEKLSDYKYVLCPPGNGVSTHRFWETLYLGSIPIILNHRIYREYTLPIIRLENWEELTNEKLESFNELDYSKEMLDFGYWRNLIEKEL